MTLYGASRKDQEAEESAVRERNYQSEQQTAEIIQHTELATKTKAVYVDGELHYIPVAEAEKLGLV